jgi:hypothetical protein
MIVVRGSMTRLTRQVLRPHSTNLQASALHWLRAALRESGNMPVGGRFWSAHRVEEHRKPE